MVALLVVNLLNHILTNLKVNPKPVLFSMHALRIQSIKLFPSSTCINASFAEVSWL